MAPLLWRERTVGALVVAWDAPHPRVEKHVTLLETFAAHASVAMENDTLIE